VPASGKFASVAFVLLWIGAGAPAQQIAFQPPAVYPAQNGSLAMVTADFNGDGILDLAVGNAGSMSVSVLMGIGNGTFHAAVNYSLPSGCQPNYLATGDFKKDGKVDLLVVCTVTPKIVILPGNGDGTFGAAIPTALPSPVIGGNLIESGTLGLAVADFDLDGNVDVVLVLGELKGGGLHAAYLLRGRGDGTFQPASQLNLGGTPVSLATGDFNGDGAPDLAAIVSTGNDAGIPQLVIALGNGQGSFTVHTSYAATIGLSLAVGDVNGDGIADIVLFGIDVVQVNNQIVTGVTVFTGGGDGSFSPTYTNQESLSADGIAGLVGTGLCFADLRGTGKPDLIEALWTGNSANLNTAKGMILDFANNLDGTFQKPVSVATSATYLPTALVAGDFDGDGRTDLAFPELPVAGVAAVTNGSGGSFSQVFAQLPPGSVTVLLNTTAVLTRTISHIANGGGFRTSIILVNTGTDLAGFTLKFWDNNGNPLALPLESGDTVSVLTETILPGVAHFIRTTGGASAQPVGWAELTAPGAIDGNAIFGLQTAGQGDSEAAVPLSPAGGTQLFLPYDDTTGFVTGIAFADSGTLAATLTASLRDDADNALPAPAPIAVPARGHYSEVLTLQYPATQSTRGVAHFSSNTSVSGLGIRANGRAFTTIEALTGVTGAPKTIAHIASGGGWKTTFLLVNADTKAASFTLKFWDDSGSPVALSLGPDGMTSSFTGMIQPGALRVVVASGGVSVVSGWASLTVTGAISGTAIFGLSTPGQPDSEAAVPFSTSGGTHLFMPYDYSPGYSTAIALVNSSTTQPALVKVTFTDDAGRVLASGVQVTVLPNGHTARVLSMLFPGIANTRGTMALTSSVPVFGLGIRADGVAFTSLKVIK
jgi:hypothetical protein